MPTLRPIPHRRPDMKSAIVLLLLVPAVPAVLTVREVPPASPHRAASATALPDSVTIDEWRVPWEKSRPRDPYVAPDGSVWFVGQVGNYLARLDPVSGKFTRTEIDAGTNPHNLVVARDGKVWYTGNRNGMIG